jgi:fructose-1,6-bisphosphatase/inositol monophosphatase family enzyme
MKKNLNLAAARDALATMVRETAAVEIMPRFLRVARQQKADETLFSEADLAAQRYLLSRLPEIDDCPVIGEEMPRAEQEAAWQRAEKEGSGLWCLDPIDGTTNFINGLPFFAVSVAYLVGGKPRIAVTYNPVSDEMFAAAEGCGATLNGQSLPLRKVAEDLSHSVAGVDFKRIPKCLADSLASESPFYSQRNFGCSTLEWCFVAAGRLDVYLHGGQMLWDYVAGSLILREAGGRMGTLAEDDFDAAPVWRRQVVAAQHPEVFASWLGWLREHCARNGGHEPGSSC